MEKENKSKILAIAEAELDSTINCLILIYQAILRALRNKDPHSSAVKAEQWPRCIPNPFTQVPASSLTKPPQPAPTKFPFEAPSLFNSYQPHGGKIHLIYTVSLQYTSATTCCLVSQVAASFCYTPPPPPPPHTH